MPPFAPWVRQARRRSPSWVLAVAVLAYGAGLAISATRFFLAPNGRLDDLLLSDGSGDFLALVGVLGRLLLLVGGILLAASAASTLVRGTRALSRDRNPAVQTDSAKTIEGDAG